MSGSASCVRCGAPLVEGAKFCRECGAAADPTQADEAAPVGGPSERECPACGASSGPGAVFCRSCGERISTEALPPPAPDLGPLPPPSEPPLLPPPRPHEARGGGRGKRVLGGVLVCLLLGVAVAAGAYFLTKDDSAGHEGTKLSRSPFGDSLTGTAGTRAKAGARAKPKPVETAPTTIADPEGPRALSSLTPGRYIQAGSFRSADGAQEEVDRLVEDGIEVEAIPADEADELLPGLQVLLVGPLTGSKAEERALKSLEDAGVSGFARDLTPSRELSGPRAAAGDWGGTFEETHLRGARRPSTYEVQFSIDSKGESGTVTYPDDDCGGTVELIEDNDFSLAYQESIEYGDCINGGVWHLRPQGSELTAVWLDEDHELMVNGTVPSQ